MKLSPKARSFVTRAVEQSAASPLKHAARRLGTDPWSGDLSPEAEHVAIAALDECRKQIWMRLGTPLAEDEAADLSNDLGFIEAVCTDLRRSINAC
jgi:hypothetical protein